MFRVLILTLVFLPALASYAQNETIDNKVVIDMTRAGLSSEIILKKIGSSNVTFDVSSAGLIALKSAGVSDDVISAMMERHGLQATSIPSGSNQISVSTVHHFSENGAPAAASFSKLDAVARAKTIAFGKSSLQPSRQALEKELLKRKDFQKLNITILRYKEEADLFVDIGFVSGSWVTHRYVYRVYDRRSGAVISAGETTSWGSLAENLARHIAKSLIAARAATS